MTVVLDQVQSTEAGTSLVLDGHSLKIEDVAAAARHRQAIQLHPAAVARIDKCRVFSSGRSGPAKSCTGSTQGLANLPKLC